MPGEESAQRRLSKDRKKALRAFELYKRGHDLRSIADMCSIPTGSAQKRVDLGRRLYEAGIK